MERITSRTNPLCAHVRKLNSSASYRRQQGEFVGEGPKLFDEARKWGAKISTVICAEQVDVDCPEGARFVEMPADVLKSLADTESPQGLIFICQMPDIELPEQLDGSQYLVLDGVQDPGNVGTIWRTADGFSCDGLLLVGACADPFSPKVVRSTMGACFRLPVWRATWDQLAQKLSQADIPVYATALRDDTEDLRRENLSRGAVVIGSEGRGVSEETLSQCKGTLKIPMATTCESLNAAVAATVVLWEMWRGQAL